MSTSDHYFAPGEYESGEVPVWARGTLGLVPGIADTALRQTRASRKSVSGGTSNAVSGRLDIFEGNEASILPPPFFGIPPLPVSFTYPLDASFVKGPGLSPSLSSK